MGNSRVDLDVVDGAVVEDGNGEGHAEEAEGVAGGEGLARDLDGLVEGVEGKGAGDAALLDGGIKLEVVDLAAVEHGDGEGQLEEANGVEGVVSGVVGHDIASHDVGSVKARFHRDGTGGGGDDLDGLDMQERRRDELLVVGAGGEGQQQPQGVYQVSYFHYGCGIKKYLSNARESFLFCWFIFFM